MKFAYVLFFSAQIYAFAFFPVLETMSDVKKFFPKSKDEIQKVKDEVIATFMESVDEMLLNTEGLEKEMIQKWDKSIGQIKVYSELMATLSMVMPTKKLRQIAQNAAIEIEQKVHEKIMLSPKLYDVLRSASENEGLNREDKRYLNNILDSFKNMGMGLNDADRQKVIELSSELTQLCAHFQSNIMEDASYTLATDSELEGVSPTLVSSLKKDGENNYILTCDYPTVFPILAQCASSETRKSLLNAFFNRAHPENTDLLETIIAKRDKIANLLGFNSFADLQLSQMLIKSPENAEGFLLSLLKKIKRKEEEEFQALKSYAPEGFDFAGDGSIFSYDTHYLWSRYRREKHFLDSEEISKYFPLESLFEKMIPFLEGFYNVEIKLSKTDSLWVSDLFVLQIQKNQNILGYVILDLFPRPGKYSHACMCPIIPAYISEDGTFFPAMNVIIANFPPTTSETPSLMTIKDIKTLYHELGHAFHDVMGRTGYILTSGTNVAIDFVEMPSQLMEEWIYEKDHLRGVSSHFESHVQIPNDIIDRIIESRSDDIASILQKQIFLSLLSLEYFKMAPNKDTSAIYERLHKFCHPNLAFCPDHHFQASFGHLDCYGATYYGYLWSKVIALNIFESFKKDGFVQMDRIKEYVEQILEQGNSVDLIQAVESYLARSINLDSFLKRLSINDMEKYYE